MQVLRLIYLLLLTSIFWTNPSLASKEKFTVDGDTLIYDTERPEDESSQGIDWEDIDVLTDILKENNNIRTLQLNSTGGSVSAATYFADVIIDYELDTNVDGTCESSCTTIFLAGEKRTIDRGSWLGFHQSYWQAEYVSEFYEDKKQEYGWENPFEFGSWLYEDTQEEVLKKLQYLTERDVKPGFAIKTMQATSDDMWYPRRKELTAAGVIREKTNE